MHAILINSDNLPKIRSSEVPDAYLNSTAIVARHPKAWYLVRGYVERGGKFLGWTVLPAYIIEKFFEHDPAKIQTDWDQIVRK